MRHPNPTLRFRGAVPSRQARRVRTLLVAVAFAGLLALAGPAPELPGPLSPIVSAAGPTAAFAGAFMQETCTQLDGTTPAPIEGWQPDTGAATATSGCDPYAGGLVARLSDATALFRGVGSGWTYTAPPGSVIGGGVVSLGFYAPQGDAYLSTPGAADDAGDVIAGCSTGSPCGGQVNGSLGGVFQITHPGGTHIYAIAQCDGPAGGDCAAGGGLYGVDAQVNMYAAWIELSNNATPAATAMGGGLLAAGPVSGTQGVTFTATDPAGPGIYVVSAVIDGKTVYAATPDSNSGHCASLGIDKSGGLAAGGMIFLSAQPCKQSVAVDIAAVDTTQFKDGRHNLKLFVEDAASNISTVYDGTITTLNAPQPVAGQQPLISGTPQVGETLTGQGVAFTTPTGQAPTVTNGWEDCDVAGGNCQVIQGTTGATYMVQPTDVGRTIRFLDTAADDDGATTVASAATQVAALPSPNNGSLGTVTYPTQGAGGQASPGAAQPASRGAPNGSPAADSATIAVRWIKSANATIASAFHGHDAMSGRLTTAGTPIEGAKIAIVGTPINPGASPTLEGTVLTAQDGTFSWSRPGNESSRALTFAYYSHIGDKTPAASAGLTVLVPAVVTLKISPRVTRVARRIVLSAQLLGGPIPPGGKEMALQGKQVAPHTAWVTFRVGRSNRSGLLRVSYRFRFAGPARYAFRAVALADASYPYETGHSNTVTVRER